MTGSEVTLNDVVDQVPVARHMKRHPLREIEPAVLSSNRPAPIRSNTHNERLHGANRRKRQVALAVVLIVCLSIPSLILALMFAG